MTQDNLDQLFREAAEHRPDRPALSFEDGTTATYGELDARVEALARRLRGRGVGTGDHVAIHLDRGPWLVESILATLRVGAVYVPVDFGSPADRIRLIVEDARPRLVISTDWTAPEDSTDEPGVLDPLTDPGGDGGGAVPPTERAASDPAYIMYTSGTTGRPKGVVVTHGNVLALLRNTAPLLQISESDVWTLFHSVAFDFSVWEMWGALGFGGRLVIPSRNTVRSPDTFLTLLHREGVTVLNATPSAFYALLGIEEGESRRLDELRLIVFGGESLDPRRLEPWLDRYGDEGPRIVNMYGITEVTVHATLGDVTAEEIRSGSSFPIGRPLPHVGISLLDTEGAEVAAGEIGEMVVTGEGVARGYLDRPELTAERFGRTDDGAPYYRSGDLASRAPDGTLRYQGRIDDQIQIRGFRVEPGEVESVASRHPGVERAVVVTATDDGGGRLDLYIVAVDDSEIGESELRRWMADRLPSYMVPTGIHTVGRIPLTPNGKVDREALSRATGQEAAPDLQAPADEDGTLERLRRLWVEALGRKDIGPRTDFFEAGGHSLMAVDILMRARSEFGVDIPLGTMFEATTLKEVALEIDQLRGAMEEFEI